MKNLKDKGFDDDFIRFFIHYICLDAWITNESGKNTDKGKLEWLIKSGGTLKTVFIDEKFDKTDLNKLRMFSPVKDMRPNPSDPDRCLEEPYEFEPVVRFIYQIRCNLFHGGKDPANANDNDIILLAGEFLEKWISCAQVESASKNTELTDLYNG